MKVIDKLAWIEIRDKRILSTRSTGKQVYYIPGGKREAGETDSEALIREIQEELSVHLEPSSLSFLGTFTGQADGHTQGTEVKMTCYSAGYEGTFKASSEIEEVVWLSYSDRDRVSFVDKIIFDWLKEENKII